MEIKFDKSFLKSIKKINDRDLNKKVFEFIKEIESASEIKEIRSIKKIIGFEFVEKSVILIIIAHRKDVYRSFP